MAGKTTIKLDVTFTNSEGFSESGSCEVEHVVDIPSNRLKGEVQQAVSGFKAVMEAARAQGARR